MLQRQGAVRAPQHAAATWAAPWPRRPPSTRPRVAPAGNNTPAPAASGHGTATGLEDATFAEARQHLQQLGRPPAADTAGPAPPHTAPPREFARWLTRRLGACGSWQELQCVWHDYYPQTNAVHVTAAASALTRLVTGAPRSPYQRGAGQQHSAHHQQSPAAFARSTTPAAASDRPELAKFATSLLCCAVDRLPELDARGVANLLHAHATLQRAAPHSTRAAAGALAALSLAAAALSAEMRPQEVSNTLWALASLGLGPRLPAQWFAEFEAGSMQAAGHMSPGEGAGALWACARLRWRPGGPWLQRMLLGADLSAAGPREVCTLLWGYATLAALGKGRGTGGGDDWEDAWLISCLKRTLQVLHMAGPADITQTWLALSRLHRAPPAPLLGPLLARTAELLPALRPQALAAVLHSLACLGLDPGPAWWAAVGRHMEGSQVLCASTPQGLAMVAWALGRLRPQQAPGTAALVASSGAALAAHARTLAAATATAAQSQQQPEGEQQPLSMGISITSLGPGAFTAPGLAALAWGLGRLGAEAPRPWFEAFEAACSGAWEDLAAGELGMVLVGLGGMRLVEAPGGAANCDSSIRAWSDAWARRALDASRRVMPGAPLREITALAVGAARLGLSPDVAWATALEDALVCQLDHSHPCQHEEGERQRQKQKQQQCVWFDLEEGDCTLSPRDASLLLWALARLSLRPSRRLARALLPAAADAAGAMNSRDAWMALWALARLWGAPAADGQQQQRPPEGVGMLADEILAGQQRRLAALAVAHQRRSSQAAAVGASDADAPLSEARAVVLSLWALSRLGHRPDPAWLDTAWTGALAPALPALAVHSPPTLTAALRALCSLRVAPSASTGWLPAIAAAAAPLLPRWPPALVTRALLSFARLRGAWVGSDWLASACGALDAHALSTLSVAELAAVVLGLSRLGHAPGAAWAGAAVQELLLRRDAGECNGDEGCEVRQHAALQSAAAMVAMD